MLKEEVSMFMSENTCDLADLFDKAVAERGLDQTLWKRGRNPRMSRDAKNEMLLFWPKLWIWPK